MIEVTFVCDLCKKKELQTYDKALKFFRVGSSAYYLTNDNKTELVQDSENYWSICTSCHEAFENYVFIP